MPRSPATRREEPPYQWDSTARRSACRAFAPTRCARSTLRKADISSLDQRGHRSVRPRIRERNAGCTDNRGRTSGSRDRGRPGAPSPEATRPTIRRSRSRAPEKSSHPGARRSGGRSLRAAREARAPTCNRCHRRRLRVVRQPPPAPASESPARRFPCARRFGPRLLAHGQPFAPPSRGRARSRQCATPRRYGYPSWDVLQAGTKSVMVMPAPRPLPGGGWFPLMTPTKQIAVVVSLLATLAAAPALADVYKCSGNGGVPIYQEEPCPKGKELRNFQVDPPEITVLPATTRTDAIPPSKASPGNAAPAAKSNDAKQGKSSSAGDASERKFIRTGMSEAEVLAKLGQPDMTAGGKNGNPARWTYMPAPGDPETITSVTLKKGTVTEVDRKAVRK